MCSYAHNFPLGEGREEGKQACGGGNSWGWKREQEKDTIKEEIVRRFIEASYSWGITKRYTQSINFASPSGWHRATEEFGRHRKCWQSKRELGYRCFLKPGTTVDALNCILGGRGGGHYEICLKQMSQNYVTQGARRLRYLYTSFLELLLENSSWDVVVP